VPRGVSRVARFSRTRPRSRSRVRQEQRGRGDRAGDRGAPFPASLLPHSKRDALVHRDVHAAEGAEERGERGGVTQRIRRVESERATAPRPPSRAREHAKQVQAALQGGAYRSGADRRRSQTPRRAIDVLAHVPQWHDSRRS